MALSICSHVGFFVDGDATGWLNAKTVRGLRLQACGWSYVFMQGGAEVSDKSLIIQIEKFDQKGIQTRLYNVKFTL